MMPNINGNVNGANRISVDHQIFRSQCANVNKLLKQVEIDCYSNKVSTFSKDQTRLHKGTKHLLQGSRETILLS